MPTTKATLKTNILKLSQLAILSAIVLIFQSLGQFIHIGPTSISLVLVPIVIGGVLLGPSGGVFLGFLFGIITVWGGVSGTDAFTNILFTAQPVETVIICLGKGVLAGFAGGLVYKALKNKNILAAVLCASAIVPIVNTGLFILGGLFLVSGTLVDMTGGTSVIYFLIIICAGLNFIAEFALNLIVSPAIHTIVRALSGKIKK